MSGFSLERLFFEIGSSDGSEADHAMAEGERARECRRRNDANRGEPIIPLAPLLLAAIILVIGRSCRRLAEFYRNSMGAQRPTLRRRHFPAPGFAREPDFEFVVASFAGAALSIAWTFSRTPQAGNGVSGSSSRQIRFASASGLQGRLAIA
jgi:hypothetical protein